MRDVTHVDLVIDPNGDVIIAYTAPFTEPEYPMYGEFDSRSKQLWFYTDDGMPREFGYDIPKAIEERFHDRDFRANLLCVNDRKIKQVFRIPILIRSDDEA